jgi:hypothetical protein
VFFLEIAVQHRRKVVQNIYFYILLSERQVEQLLDVVLQGHCDNSPTILCSGVCRSFPDSASPGQQGLLLAGPAGTQSIRMEKTYQLSDPFSFLMISYRNMHFMKKRLNMKK